MSELNIPVAPHPRLDLPKSLAGLAPLALNLRWSWDPESQDIFREIDPEMWADRAGPVKILQQSPRLAEREKDKAFTARIQAACDRLEAYQSSGKSKEKGLIAYFCAEYGLHESFALYSGGLGILAGDHCKEASDLALPFVAIGLYYRRGFFYQVVDAEGRQEHLYPAFDPEQYPVQEVLNPKTQSPLRLSLEFPGRSVTFRVWRVQCGRIPMLLLDTDLPENSPADRKITSQLYTSGREMRLHQEIVLGMGGVKVLSALGLKPSVFHMNEGHSAFLLLQRMKDLGKGSEATIKKSSILTIHTPVAAGNERFDAGLVERTLSEELKGAPITFAELAKLAVDSEKTKGIFDLTALALRLSRLQNGVSLLHGKTADGTWRKVAGQEVIGLTNGVHMPTWLGPEMRTLMERSGASFAERTNFDKLEQSDWRGILKAPDEEVWAAHQAQKARLVAFANQRMFEQHARHGEGPSQLDPLLEALDPEAFIIGFARRFATYKRAHLILSNARRFAKIFGHKHQKVQIVFAGKAHPADRAGQSLIAKVYAQTVAPKFRGKVFFLEDYDMEVGRMLVQGVDIWLNNPRRPLEASGTSGMKAAANGVPNVSVLDGWWDEAYRAAKTRNGWAVGGRKTVADEKAQDKADAEALYDVLEQEVLPLYFDRKAGGLPAGWVQVMKESIASSAWQFSTRRMLEEYCERMYR